MHVAIEKMIKEQKERDALIKKVLAPGLLQSGVLKFAQEAAVRQAEMASIAQRYTDAWMLPSSFIGTIQETTLELAKNLQNILSPVREILKTIDFETLAKFKIRLDNIEKSDFEYKWLKAISIPLGDKLMKLYEEGGNKKVNEYLVSLFRDEKSITAFKDDLLKGQPAYDERKDIIDDCLQAHLDKKYSLSIPVLLAQCDGIIINKVVEKALYTGKDAKHVNMKKVAKDKKVYIDEPFANHMISLYETKRLEILHGKDYLYHKDGEALSVKIIWTLTEIIYFVSQIK